MMALADLDDILIKMIYVSDSTSSSLVKVMFEYATERGNGQLALEVENCQCPIGYVGTSCEVIFIILIIFNQYFSTKFL